MTLKLKIYLVILLVPGILAGLVFHNFFYNQFHLFGEFNFPTFFVLLTIVLALGLIFFWITKSLKVVKLATFVIAFFCTSIITSNIILKIAERKAINLAENIIEAIFQYQHDHKYFPKSLDSLKTNNSLIIQFRKTQAYKLDQKGTSFYIYAWSDGWYNHVFFSADSSWHLID